MTSYCSKLHIVLHATVVRK